MTATTVTTVTVAGHEMSWQRRVFLRKTLRETLKQELNNVQCDAYMEANPQWVAAMMHGHTPPPLTKPNEANVVEVVNLTPTATPTVTPASNDNLKNAVDTVGERLAQVILSDGAARALSVAINRATEMLQSVALQQQEQLARLDAIIVSSIDEIKVAPNRARAVLVLSKLQALKGVYRDTLNVVTGCALPPGELENTVNAVFDNAMETAREEIAVRFRSRPV